MPLEQLLIVPISVIAFGILLMFIVFFHEYGHFSVARLLGVRVDVFSIGFGKPLARWVDRKGTEWRIAMIPLGGYVKFFGDANAASMPDRQLSEPEPSEEKNAARPGTTQFPSPTEALAAGMTAEERKVCFHFKPVWARAMVVAAGPMANFLLAIVIFAGLLMVFGRYVAPPVAGEIREGSAAQAAGFQVDDRILEINGRRISRFREVQGLVQLGTGDEMTVVVDRGGEQVTLSVTPRREEIVDAFGNKESVGMLGFIGYPGAVEFRKYGPLASVGEGAKEVWRIITTTVRFLGRLIQGKESTKLLGGPVKMAKYAGQAASSGFSDDRPAEISFVDRLKISLTNFINLAAFISVSIGFLNLLPIPVLDGGHLVYYAFEAATGKPLDARIQAAGFQIGLVILFSFMIFVTWNDISGLVASVLTTRGS
ncbi:MAG: RIP metalloprotease [Pseudomonadota bacterium]